MSGTECIHGFENQLCDSCFPKAAPVKPVTRATTSSRTKRVPGAPRASSNKLPLLADQRVYHVTHISNLENILRVGQLVAAAQIESTILDVSSPLTRELRGTASLSTGEPVDRYVPFSLVPESNAWRELRDGAIEPRWSDAARSASSTDFVFLVTTIRALGDDAVLADGDAAASLTRFAEDEDTKTRMLGNLRADELTDDAEVLIHGSFAFDEVQLVGVASDRARDRVKELLDAASFATKVAVYPPWFIQ
ncbi:DarT ssDNA thymidine ADP-ribosyltransferase family protein [Salinibacterium sp. PAMC 21357]|uniref:DarT ssDNA thymidine ADP-ribosyltransferase family protein n=1 Tax=Salinibacterium sp. PAMC 21357 TaxID=1112215 RepID=UPI0002FA4D84|nr:DarT ssDNA thymidine ADP-ribosyltransferase family protein [Salinibacterium sp. PAMC 21357]